MYVCIYNLYICHVYVLDLHIKSEIYTIDILMNE